MEKKEGEEEKKAVESRKERRRESGMIERKVLSLRKKGKGRGRFCFGFRKNQHFR